jgi:hypothetical protein
LIGEELRELGNKMKIPADISNKLKTFKNKCGGEINKLVDKVNERPLPPMIFHYTNDSGLKGILEGGNLWLTNITNLNDPTELKYGFSHAIKFMNERAESGHEVTRNFARRFEEFMGGGHVEKIAHHFVCCFSSEGDDLGQWRSYSDNGRGFALGFETKLLEDAFTKKPDPSCSKQTFRLTYSDNELLNLNRNTIERVFPLIALPVGRGLDDSALNAYVRSLFETTWMQCLLISLFFKHEQYAYEAEYRFLETHPGSSLPHVEFRMKPYELVTYRVFSWRKAAPGALKKIVIGPAADKTKAALFVESCLQYFHPGHPIEVVQSTIPYRS